MAFSTAQWKAIKWFADTEDLIPQMSVYPVVTFKERATGKLVEHNISSLEIAFTGHKASERRRKSTEAKEKKRNGQTKRPQ